MPNFIFTDGYVLPANDGDKLWIETDCYWLFNGEDTHIPRETIDIWRLAGMAVERGVDACGRPNYVRRHLVRHIPTRHPSNTSTKQKIVVASLLAQSTPFLTRDSVLLQYKFSPYLNRIAQSIAMLAQRSALTTQARNTGELHIGEDYVHVYPFTNDEYDEAKLVIQRFSNAIAKRVLKTETSDEDVQQVQTDMASLMGKLTKLLINLFSAVSQGTGEYSMREYIRYINNDIKNLARATLVTACNTTGWGYMLAHYDLEYDRLTERAIRDLRCTMMNNYISDLLGYDDSDDVDELLHEYDFVRCDDCGDWEASSMTSSVVYSDNYICRVCVDNHYTFSDYHGSYVHNEDVRTALNRHGDEVEIHQDCEDFSYDDDEETYVHHAYSPPSRVLTRYHTAKGADAYRLIHSEWSKQNERYFGIELEVECRKGYPGEYADKLNDVLNDGDVGTRCFFEEDGSLSNGFEIITQPMGLDMHYQFWEWLQDKKLVTNLRSHDTSTCGLHVHINRNNINTMQMNKMAVFVHSPDNRNLIKAISRRYAVGYASMHAKKLGTAHQASRSDPRYEAINLTNRRTIELRIFKGSLKHESVLAALEFTNALVKFTAPASPAGFMLNTTKFMDFINADYIKQDTRHLRKYLTDVGFTA